MCIWMLVWKFFVLNALYTNLDAFAGNQDNLNSPSQSSISFYVQCKTFETFPDQLFCNPIWKTSQHPKENKRHYLWFAWSWRSLTQFYIIWHWNFLDFSAKFNISLLIEYLCLFVVICSMCKIRILIEGHIPSDWMSTDVIRIA